MLSACATVIPHEPNAALSQEDAKKALKQAFEEQPADFRPVAIEIGDDAIRMGYDGGQGLETYYYSNLEEPQLLQKRERYQIELANAEPRFRRWVLFYSQDKAFAFIAAVQRMRRTRLASTEGLAERLATVPRVVADDQAVDVSGVEITGEERERWQAQRSANINKYTVNPFGEPRF